MRDLAVTKEFSSRVITSLVVPGVFGRLVGISKSNGGGVVVWSSRTTMLGIVQPALRTTTPHTAALSVLNDTLEDPV